MTILWFHRIGLRHFFTGLAYNSRRSTTWKNWYWSRTGGSVSRTINNNFSEKLGIFPENVPICQGKFGQPQIVSGAEIMSYFPGAKRRGNIYYFGAAQDDCGWQLLQQCGNSSSSAELSAGSFTFGLTSREETCCPPTSTLYCFLTAGQLFKRFSAKTYFEHSFITNS